MIARNLLVVVIAGMLVFPLLCVAGSPKGGELPGSSLYQVKFQKAYPLREENQKYFGSYYRNGHPVGEDDQAPNREPKCRAVYYFSINPMRSAPTKAYSSNPVAPPSVAPSDDLRLGKFHHSIEIGLHARAEDPEGRINCDLYSNSDTFAWNEKNIQKAFGAGFLKLTRVAQKPEASSSTANTTIKELQPEPDPAETGHIVNRARPAAPAVEGK